MTTILITEDDLQFAKQIMKTMHSLKITGLVASILNTDTKGFRELTRRIQCDYCNAQPSQHCTTSTGKTTTKTHHARTLLLLAAISAIEHETIIQEAPEITDP